MKIGACYIVKDEAEELEKSLRSLRAAVDEIVVVNTGSREEVNQAAEAFGASTVSYSWRDHFAAARNFALEQMKSPWIVFLDADEAFLYPEQVRGAIEEKLAEEPELDAMMIMRYNVKTEKRELNRGYDLALRILRNAPELRYEGRIHEQVKKAGGELVLGYTDERLAVSHTGYAGRRNEEKAERNLRLLELDIEAAGGVATPAQNSYLADCYLIRREYDKALRCALSALDSDVKYVGMSGDLYHTVLECMRKLDMDPEDMLALARLASEKLPELPEFYAEQAMVLCSMGRLEEAETLFLKAIEIYRENPVHSGEASYFSDRALAIAEKKLAEIYHLWGDDERAEEYFRRAFRTDPENEPAREAYEKYLRDKREQSGKKSFLSACYIVRNEAAQLARSLESIRGEWDELVVVDTGSEDNTLEVAKSYGARCCSFPWRNDFAAARNFALEQLRGEWILFLDADEYFSENTGGRIRNLLQQNSSVNQFLLFLRNVDEDTGEVLLDSYAPRLFRNRPDFRYEGRIHEELLQGGEPIRKICTVPEKVLTLMHTGYSSHLNRQKAERNLGLLLEELKTAKHPERLYMYLVEACEGVGDEEQAIAWAEKDLATGRKPVVYASRSYRSLLRLLAKHPERAEKRLWAAGAAVKDFPEVPEFHAEYAECLAAAGRYREALAELDRAEAAFGEGPGWEPSLFPEEMRPMLQERKALWTRYLREDGSLQNTKQENSRQDWKKLQGELSRDIQRIPGLLFLLEKENVDELRAHYLSCRELLPQSLRRIWAAYESGGACENQEEGYELILSQAIRHADDSQLLRYVEIGKSLPVKSILEMGNRLMEEERWQAAFAAYSMIPEDGTQADAEFWYRIGRCLFHLKEWEGAELCLTKALTIRQDYPAAASFLKWTREAKEQ